MKERLLALAIVLVFWGVVTAAVVRGFRAPTHPPADVPEAVAEKTPAP